MARYFTALGLAPDACDALESIAPEVAPGRRLNRRDELHVTLHFLGEVEPAHDAALRAALASVSGQAFSLSLRGVGRFPEEGPASTLWTGVERNPKLYSLHYLIGTTLAEAIGFQPEERPYVPHVTLARLAPPSDSPAIDAYLERRRHFHFGPTPVDRFLLYSSGHSPDGVKYRVEAEYPLAAAAKLV